MATSTLSRWLAAAAVVVVIAAIVYFAFPAGQQTPGGVLSATIPLRLTDPPQVPAGTSSLLVSYSAVQAHVVESAGGSSSWLQASGSGSIDLMQLLNLSEVIATVSAPKNATVNMVRFNITSATITINGTSYSVTVPSGSVTAHIHSETSVNGTSSVLLQLSPTVASIVTSNSTVFVLVPSLKAVIVPGSTQSSVSLGSRAHLEAHDKTELENATANITISSASLSVQGNTTAVSVTVKNNANTSVALKGVALFGNMSVLVNNTGIVERSMELGDMMSANITSSEACRAIRALNSTGGLNASAIASITGDMGGEGMMHSGFNLTGFESGMDQEFNVSSSGKADLHAGIFGLNMSGQEDLHMALNSSQLCSANGTAYLRSAIEGHLVNLSADLGILQSHMRMVVLRASANGSLSVPSDGVEFEGQGVTLQAGQSETFTFDGSVSFARAHLLIKPISGDNYSIRAIGDEGAFAATNVTAG